MGRSMKYRSSDSVFFLPREGDIQVNSPGELHTVSLLSKCAESFDPIFPRGGGGGEMLVAPHRVAAGQRFGLGSGPCGSGCSASGRLEEFLFCSWQQFAFGNRVVFFFLIGAKVAPLFSVCAVLANVSPLTNNTSCEAASIIKKAGLLHM